MIKYHQNRSLSECDRCGDLLTRCAPLLSGLPTTGASSAAPRPAAAVRTCTAQNLPPSSAAAARVGPSRVCANVSSWDFSTPSQVPSPAEPANRTPSLNRHRPKPRVHPRAAPFCRRAATLGLVAATSDRRQNSAPPALRSAPHGAAVPRRARADAAALPGGVARRRLEFRRGELSACRRCRPVGDRLDLGGARRPRRGGGGAVGGGRRARRRRRHQASASWSASRGWT